MGLIAAKRHKENRYRLFTFEQVRQILTIYALKISASASRHKHSIAQIREELRTFDYHDKDRITAMTKEIGQYLNQVNRAQIQAISALDRLCRQVETRQFAQPG